MFDEHFRRVLPALVHPTVRALARLGVTPNQVTVGAALLGVGAGLMMAGGMRGPAIIAWLASRLLDGIDGILARHTGSKSAFGGYLDITLDMAAYSAMLFGFWVLHPEAGWAWPAILAGYLLVTTSTLALSSILEQQQVDLPGANRTFKFTPGLAEAGETSMVYVLLTLLPAWVTPIAWVWAAMCGVTVVQRTLLARRLLAP